MTYISKHFGVKGFSLVEILVVLGLFSSIATLSLGSLFNAQSVNRRLQETQAILDNVNLSTQTVTRDIRFGTDFYATTSLPYGNDAPPYTRRNCPQSSPTACTILIFTPSDSKDYRDRVAYYIKNGVLYKTTYPYGSSSSTEQMTSSDVTIKSLFFYLEGAQTSLGDTLYDDNGAIDYKQPLITFLLSGITKPAGGAMASTTFDFETNISPRELDNQ